MATASSHQDRTGDQHSDQEADQEAGSSVPPLASPQGTSVVVGIPMRRTLDDPRGAVHDPRLLAGIERAGFFGARLRGESTWGCAVLVKDYRFLSMEFLRSKVNKQNNSKHEDRFNSMNMSPNYNMMVQEDASNTRTSTSTTGDQQEMKEQPDYTHLLTQLVLVG
ncbi:unnamed protein product, partial [Amoebophrya sp. A25]|eukprot:GSA25T00023276001.1